jgi:hypothetical protein
MSLLDHPEAQALLADAVVTRDAVRVRADRLTTLLQRDLPTFYRVEQRATAARSSAAGSALWTARPPSRSPLRRGCRASRSRSSSARASGTTRP